MIFYPKLNSPGFLRSENIIIISYKIYNFNIAVKKSHKVSIRVNSYIVEVQKTDFHFGVGFVQLLVTMYVSPFLSM